MDPANAQLGNDITAAKNYIRRQDETDNLKIFPFRPPGAGRGMTQFKKHSHNQGAVVLFVALC